MADTAVKIPFAEAAAPSTPAANKVVIYAKSDGLMYSKDDAGTETLMSGGAGGGSVATDAIWDAAGDLAVGTGANTAARLAIGATNGMALQRVSGAAAWALPPGYEFDYAQVTSPVSVTATAEASADNIVSGNAVTYDGSTTVIIECYAPSVEPSTGTVGRFVQFFIFDGSSSIGTIGVVRTPATGTSHIAPVLARRRLTPSAAAHTYHFKAVVSAGTGTVTVGAGGSGNYSPGYIRITKV